MSATDSANFEPRAGESWRDPFTMYRALRDHDPVHRVASDDGDYWVLSRFGDVFAAVVDAATFSSAAGLTMAYGEMEKLGVEAPIVMMDPPDHTKLRKLSIKRFTPQQVRAIEPMVRAFVVERVERLREMGEGDIVAELLKPLPSVVVAHFLGVPQEDRSLFDRWTDSIVAANALGDVLSAGEAVGEMFGYFAALIEKRRADPVDDMLSTLVHAKINGEPVSPAQILGMGFTMVTGGNDTTTGLLSGALELLTRYPEQRARLLADPALMPRALEEFLRLTSPVQGLARTTTREAEIDVDGTKQTIPRKKKVMLLYGSANRDERQFDAPDVLDTSRKPTQHLAFGFGTHFCLGASLARLESQIGFEQLLARAPEYKLLPGAERNVGGIRGFMHLPAEFATA